MSKPGPTQNTTTTTDGDGTILLQPSPAGAFIASPRSGRTIFRVGIAPAAATAPILKPAAPNVDNPEAEKRCKFF